MGATDIARILLKRGTDASIVDANGDTPLQVALQEEHSEIGGLFREYGAAD